MTEYDSQFPKLTDMAAHLPPLIAAAHRAQADALEIEARAKRRLADEYDAAQERGEVAGQGKPSRAEGYPATTSEIGLTHKDIHEARIIRDAEAVDPGSLQQLVSAVRTIRERPIVPPSAQ